MQKQCNTQRALAAAAAAGFLIFNGPFLAVAAEGTKKSTEQAAPSGTKKAPAKKGTAKGADRQSKPTAAKGQAPQYTSAETAAKATACFGETPKIESVKPDEGKAGDKVTISGRNFGPAECLRSLSFGPGHSATFKFESETQITATVPSGRRKGLVMMTVTTASGEVSKPFLVK